MKLSKKIPSGFPLRGKENLMIAKSYLFVGEPKKAVDYLTRVIYLRRGTREACLAHLMLAEVDILLNQTKKAVQELKNLLYSYCAKDIKDRTLALLYYLKKIRYSTLKIAGPEEVKKAISEMYELKGIYFLKRGKLKQAEGSFFSYIDFGGNYKKAAKLFFDLAEKYFAKGNRAKAKLFYKLIITKWEGTTQSLLSKFRLYQIAYEEILIKELVPPVTKRNLLFYISVVKMKFPHTKLVEDASYLETKIYFEDGKYDKARKSAVYFMKNFPKSKRVSEVKKIYCTCVTTLLKNYLENHKLEEAISFEKEEDPWIKESSCGKVFFIMGNLFFKYKLYPKAVYEFIKAWENTISPQDEKELFLKLCFLAVEENDTALAKDLLNVLEKQYKNKIKNNFLYFYIKAYFELKKDIAKAEVYLKGVLSSKIDDYFKFKLLRLFWEQAMKLKLYDKALTYLKNPYFKADLQDYIVMLIATFNENRGVFLKVLKIAEKKYPENSRIKWISAYFMEKNGNIKLSSKIWKSILNGTFYENELARSYEKMRKLVEEAHKLVF